MKNPTTCSEIKSALKSDSVKEGPLDLARGLKPNIPSANLPSNPSYYENPKNVKFWTQSDNNPLLLWRHT
jgi:hypothetical protein